MGPAGQEMQSAGSGGTSDGLERLGNGEELLPSVNRFEKTSTTVISPCYLTYFIYCCIILPLKLQSFVSAYCHLLTCERVSSC